MLILYLSLREGQTYNVVIIAKRIHLFPYRTQKLSSLAAMVLGGRPPGRVARSHVVCRSGGTGRRTGLKILRDLYSRTGSIPVCGMILSERNVDFTAFLSLFCLLDIFAEKIKQMRISMLDQ